MEEMILEKLFESVPKVRLLRIFMRNADVFFTLDDLVKRSKVTTRVAKKELGKLLKIRVIFKEKHTFRTEKPRKRGKAKIISRRAFVFSADKNFGLYEELKNLVANSSLTSREKILQRLKGVGRIKLIILSGVFLKNDLSRIDLLIVGERVNKRKFDTFLQNTESEIGKSLRYAIMDTEEFRYRMDMYDRFLRDIFEFSHEKLLNKLNI